MIDALVRASMMKLDFDEANEIYEKITQNQSMCPINRKAQRKMIDAMTALTAQLEVLTTNWIIYFS